MRVGAVTRAGDGVTGNEVLAAHKEAVAALAKTGPAGVAIADFGLGPRGNGETAKGAAAEIVDYAHGLFFARRCVAGPRFPFGRSAYPEREAAEVI